jgi:hypothetical protein
MTSRTRALAAVVLSLALAAPAAAQSKKELVNRILLLQQPGVEALARGIAEQPAMRIAQAARLHLQNVPTDKREATFKAVDADLKRYVDETVPLVRERAIKLAPGTLGTELETNFSETELKQLIDWLESPVIKRFQQLSPQIERTLIERLVNDTRGQVEPKLKALEASVSKHLGLPPPQAGGAGAPAGPAGAAGAPAPSGAAGLPGNRGGEPPRK